MLYEVITEGDHSVSLSPDGKYFTDTYSQPDVPGVTVVRNAKGKLITTLEKTDVSRLEATGWKAPEVFSVKSADKKWDLYGLMFTPSNLDKTKKYPVIVYIYPGPQGGSVGSWNFNAARNDNQALAEFVITSYSIHYTKLYEWFANNITNYDERNNFV